MKNELTLDHIYVLELEDSRSQEEAAGSRWRTISIEKSHDRKTAVLTYEHNGTGDLAFVEYALLPRVEVIDTNADGMSLKDNTAKEIQIVGGLPALPDEEYPEGVLVYDSITKRMYRVEDNSWVDWCKYPHIYSSKVAKEVEDPSIGMTKEECEDKAQKIKDILPDYLVCGIEDDFGYSIRVDKPNPWKHYFIKIN